MKTLFSAFLVLTFWSKAQCQSFTYFNKTYEPDTVNLLTPALLAVEDGYLLASPYGYHISGYHSYCLRKTDLQGNPVWIQMYETSDNLVYAIEGGILIPAPDDNFLLVGARNYNSGGESNLDVTMIKVRSDGSLIWANHIPRPETHENVLSVLPTHDGNYVFCGTRRSTTGNDYNHVYLLRTDSLGNFLSDTLLHPERKGFSARIINALDGGYMIGGYLTNPIADPGTPIADPYIVKWGEDGTVEWERTYGGIGNDGGSTITAWGDQHYLVLGALTENDTIQHYILKIKADNGDTVWTRTYQQPNCAHSSAFNGQLLTSDGGFV